MQVPTAISANRLPLVVQTSVVLEAKVTGLPDSPPVAFRVIVPPTEPDNVCVQVIVCGIKMYTLRVMLLALL